MSIPDDEENRSFKKSALKMFGRRASSRTRPPRLMQLPDIAVAAKTLNGARHIAISIPLQYDHPDIPSPSRPNPLGSSPASKFPPPVTVLKPVVEAREPTSSNQDLEGKRDGSSQDAPAELLGPETTKTLKNYYTQLHRQHQHKLKSESISSLKTGESRSARSSQAGTSTEISRQDHQPNDPRHSGGTVYSTITISPHDYSRRMSTVSNAPSMNPASPIRSDLPSRNSSVPKPIQTELAQSYNAASFPSHQDPPRSSVMAERTESLKSDASNYSSHSRLPHTPHEYAPSHTEQIQNPTSPLPAPTRLLPDVPESPCIPDFLPSPSPRISRRKITIGLIDEVTGVPVAKNTDELLTPTSQSRQERVRARKSRDMAALREKRGSRETMSDAASTTNVSRASSPGSRPGSSPQTRKRRSKSRDRVRRNRCTLTSIMLVADLAPEDGTGRLPVQPTNASVRTKASNSSIMPSGTYTPPRSSLGSDSDLTAKMTEANGFPVDRSSTSSEQMLEDRRQERRVKRNMSLREKELESRLRKIERDNAMLLNTLSGIAGSFGQLHNLLPRQVVQTTDNNNNVLVKGKPRGRQGVAEQIQKLEPVMRELQAVAGRVSMEDASSSSSTRRAIRVGEDGASTVS